MGFSGKEVKIVVEMINNLHSIESDTDKMQIKIRKKLFALESELPPVDVMFLYQVIKGAGQLADRAQRVGDGLQMLMTR